MLSCPFTSSSLHCWVENATSNKGAFVSLSATLFFGGSFLWQAGAVDGLWFGNSRDDFSAGAAEASKGRE